MRLGMTRRRAILAAGIAAAGHLRAARAQSGPLRIGQLVPLSGPAQATGNYHRIGAEIGAGLINSGGGILGRQLEVVVRDDKGDANAAVAALRELTDSGINLFIGGILTNTALAAEGVIGGLGAVMITTAAIGDALTQQNFARNLFRVTESGAIRGRMLGRFAAQRFPQVLAWGGIVPDNEAGDSQWRGFVSGASSFYRQLNGTSPRFQEPLRTKSGTTDFRTEITRLMDQPLEGFVNAVASGDAVTLFTQGRAFGLNRKLKVGIDFGNDIEVANALGRNAPPEFWTASHWWYQLYQDNPQGKALYDAYVARTGQQRPSGHIGPSAIALQVYRQAIETAGSTAGDAVIGALEAGSFATAGGMRRFRREDHQALGEFNAYRVLATDSDPSGWAPAGALALPDAEAALPATPGRALQYP